MMAIFEQMMRCRDNDASVEKAIDRIVEVAGQFNGRNITEFLDAYKREMNQRDVSEARQILSFKRVAANNVQRRVIEVQEGKTTWYEFEKAILAAFVVEDLSRITRHVLMKWIEKKDKKMSASRVYDEFDQMFSRLPATDQVLLEEDKTLYFLKAVDMKDRRELGTLLEDDTEVNGLVTNWTAVKVACNKLNKRRQWLDDIDLVGLSIEKTRPSKVVEPPKQCILDEKKIDDDSRTAYATSREDECFGTRIVFETSDNEGASLIKACVKGDKECKADMIEDLATKIDIKEVATNKTTSVDGEHSKTFLTMVPETWAVASENRHKTQETDDGGKEKLKADVKEDQRKKDSFTHVPETWAVATESQRETQEMEGDKKGKDQDGVQNKESEQSSERDDDGHVGHVDPKDEFATSIEEDNGCDAHEIDEAATKNVIKEVGMNDTTKAVDQMHMESSTPVLETSAVVPMSQRETGETEGGSEEEKDKAMAKGGIKEGSFGRLSNRKTIWPVFRPGRKKIWSQVRPKRKLNRSRANWPNLTQPTTDPAKADRSNPIQKRVDSPEADHLSPIRRNANLDEGRPSQKTIDRDRSRQQWSWTSQRSKPTSRGTRSRLVSMRKDKLESRKDDQRKFDDEGDGRNEGGTCTMHEGLCLGEAKRAMTTGHGIAKCERRIWWIGWRKWFMWKEWT